MKLLVKKSVYEEFIRPKIYLSFSYGTIEKAFNSAVHPRDERGRFTDKGIMELTEQEREELLDYLEKEEYEDYEGVYVSSNKIKAVKSGLYADEIEACKILKKYGFDIYLLDEKYVGGKKADTFFKKDEKKDFLEIKHTSDKKITALYNSSVKQAPNCFIVVDGYMSKVQKKNLSDAVNKNINAKDVYVYLKSSDKFLKIK